MRAHLISALIVSSFSLSAQDVQTPWQRETAQGFPIDEGKLETTEGFGAYLDFCLRPNTKNFDNGGGTHNYNTVFLKKYHGVENVVFDPYQRSQQDNEKALQELAKHDFDTATSNSVLNVIDSEDARLKHISLSCEALKEGGRAFFKVWPGDNSQKEVKKKDSYQSNRPALTYQSDVEKIFGKGNVVVDIANHMIIAYKNSSCSKLIK